MCGIQARCQAFPKLLNNKIDIGKAYRYVKLCETPFPPIKIAGVTLPSRSSRVHLASFLS